MLAQDREDALLLTKLGLTLIQAEIYITLTRTGKATAKHVAQVSCIDRANVYRVITRLEELNLVERIIDNPILFEAAPLEEGISILLENKSREFDDIKLKTTELIKKCRNKNENNVKEERYQFVWVPDGQLTYRKIVEMISNCTKSQDVLFCWKDLEPKMGEIQPILKQLLKRGVKIRFIAYTNGGDKPSFNFDDLKGSGLFEIRWTSKFPKSMLSIYDKHEALMTLLPSPFPQGTPSLWANNPGLIAILNDYFEGFWDTSIPLEDQNQISCLQQN